MRHKRPSRGKIISIVGLLLIAAALCLAGYNVWDSERAGHDAEQLVQQLDDSINSSSNSDDQSTSTDGDEETTTETTADGKLPVITIDGYDYIGELQIPSLGVTLPVMGEWDYGRLRVSPCRYAGSYIDNDLVICGHNYPSHFRGLLSIDVGADVYFETVTGQRIHYLVANREIVQPTSIEEMIENQNNSESSGQWDLTLFTCTIGGQTRCAVRCSRQDS